MPDFEILPFVGGGACPVQYTVEYGGQEYYIRYRNGWLSITRDMATEQEEEVFEQELTANSYDGEWNDEQTTVYLALISQAIRSGDFTTLRLPNIEATSSHPFYRKGPLPIYRVGLICGKEQSPIPKGCKMNRHDRRKRREAGLHDHEDACYVYVPADQAQAWIKDHPEQHQALKEEIKRTRRLWK